VKLLLKCYSPGKELNTQEMEIDDDTFEIEVSVTIARPSDAPGTIAFSVAAKQRRMPAPAEPRKP